MALLKFQSLSFREKEVEVQVILLNLFYADIPLEELKSIGFTSLKDAHTLEFQGDKDKAERKFLFLLEKYIDRLKNKLTGNSATYIHKFSEIPLIGNVAFGIVYRNSSIIEIKPVTSCNLNCPYCSISEGLYSKKHDFIVEREYLVDELKNLITSVDESIEVHIGVQGEPFLYAEIEELFEDLQAMEQVHTISIDTNGTLLSKERIDRIAKNTKLQLNLSLDAIDVEVAKKMAGVPSYSIEHVQEMIRYASEKMAKRPIVAPVLTQGFNEAEMEKIVLFIKSLPKQPILGIQNFLRYKTGRNPAPEMSWEFFYGLIADLEKKHDIKLKLSKEDFRIREIKELPKPFRAGEVVTALIKCMDRFPHTVIAVAKNRTISVPRCEFKKDKKVTVKIVRDKHNIFVGNIV